MNNPTRPRRRSIRLQDYDYATPGAYFVTICTSHRVSLLGEIVDWKMQLNSFGEIVSGCWEEIPRRFDGLSSDIHVVMPNHFHGIICLADPVGARSPRPYTRPTLGKVIAYFKYHSTKQVNVIRNRPGMPLGQRGYYDHVIRNETDLEEIREYILNNPAKWEEDENHPTNITKRL